MKKALIFTLFLNCAYGFYIAQAQDQTATSATSNTAFTADEIKAIRAKANLLIKPLPAQMPGSENDTPALVDLGKKLFFDTILSDNRTMSCNSCHMVDQRRGGVDNEPTSEGTSKKRGGRNSPTVLNAGFQFAQFWDGRAATLEDQAKGPVLNPIEMAMPNETEVLQRLRDHSEYPALFQKAFPNATPVINYDNMAKAIAAFERTLITHDRFDDFMQGDDQALSKAELAGLNLFLTTGCTTCHNGPTIGGRSFQKVGLVNAYEDTSDVGRFGVTKEDDDKYKFKVPMLRNIALTAPYFHDGKLTTLDEVVPKMAWMQLGKKLSDGEVKSIVSFLKSLTDKSRDVKARLANN